MVPILIVDDSREDRILAQRVLAESRILNPVVPISSGKVCVQYFLGKSTNAEPQLPCIVLLDMIMKPVSGLEVLRKLTKIPAARHSVLIMLSGLTDIKMISEGYRLGASTFLIKPIITREIAQMLGSINGLILTKTPKGSILSIKSVRTVSLFSNQRDYCQPPSA